MNDELPQQIIIGLGTFRRNDMLQRALESIERILFPESTTVSLVVCDNNSLPSAKPVFLEMKEKSPFEWIYLHEPQQGLVNMRNRILQYSIRNKADYLAFFDDDEYVDENWLLELYKTIRRHKAAAVGGLVVTKQADAGVSAEIVNYFKNLGKTGATGEEKDELATNNVLIDLHFIRNYAIEFRGEFNFLGGEDAFFFEDIKLKGGKLIWCNEAKVYTEMPLDRLNLTYALKMQTRIVHFEYLKTVIRYGKVRAFWKILVLCYKHLTTMVRKKTEGNLTDFEFERRKVAIRAGFSAIFGAKLDFYRTDEQ